jgi:hypothetical protein
MPQPVNIEKRLSKTLAKQESLISELQALTERHGGDGEGEARAILMTWASSLEALKNAREALDDLVESVHYAALREADGQVVRRRPVDSASPAPMRRPRGPHRSPKLCHTVACL